MYEIILLDRTFRFSYENQDENSIKMRIKTDSKQFELKEDPEEVEQTEQKTEHSRRPVDYESMETNDECKNKNIKEAEKYEEDQSDAGSDIKSENMKINEDSVVPTESPNKPGPNDQACSATPLSQRSEINQDEASVRCACGCNEDDGLMIMCAICKHWQHGVCFLILNEKEAPEWHVCEVCAKTLDSDKESTDPYLKDLSTIAVQATCLWRRVLVAATEMNRILPHHIAKRLGVEITVAQGLLNRMDKEGLVKNPSKGKRLGKQVQKEKLENESIPKYFKKKSVVISSDTESVSMKHDQIEKDDVIADEVKKLTDKTEEMRISKSKSKGSDAQCRKSPRLQHKEEEVITENQKRGKKRALSKSDEMEFDLCDSQDMENETSRTSRKKASVVAKAIMV